MSNYKYRLIDIDYVLTPEEHGIVGASVKEGKTQVYLRGGTMMINMSFVGAINPTNEKTDKQVLTQGAPQLPEGDYEKSGVLGLFKATHEDFYARMGWKHEENCSCKQESKVEIIKKL